MRKAWKQAEVSSLIALRADGFTVRQIATRIGRNHNQVLGKTFRLRRAGLIVDNVRFGSGFTILTRHAEPQSIRELTWRANDIVAETHIGRRTAFEIAWREARERAGERIPDLPRSLGSFVVKCGGIKPSRHTRGVAICYLNRSGCDAAEMSYIAADNGYSTDGCPHELIDMLTDEAAGVRHYSEHDLDALVIIEEFERGEQSIARMEA